MKFFWRGHTSAPYAFPRRVWREDWPVDRFEIVYQADFWALEAILARFSIPFLEAEDNNE